MLFFFSYNLIFCFQDDVQEEEKSNHHQFNVFLPHLHERFDQVEKSYSE